MLNIKQQEKRKTSRKSLRSLDALNLFLVDVSNTVGPYISVYLKSSQGWNPAQIGIVLSVSTIATVLSQTPAGALVDSLKQKRLLIVIAGISVAVGYLLIAILPFFPVVFVAQIVVGIAAAFFGPTVTAITLGLVGHDRLERRLGRNESFNHAGNVVIAILAGLISKLVSSRGIFFLVAAMSIGTIVSVLKIRPREIDHQLARGATDNTKQKKRQRNWTGLTELLQNPSIRLLVLAVVLFSFANGAMLPLVSQRLAEHKDLEPAVFVSACIIVAQLVMVPTANLAGRFSENGRKPVFLVAFIVLAIRGLLYTLSANPYFLVSVQILNGVAGGIFGVLSVLMIADLTKGSGKFNLTLGLINMSIGIGAGLSNALIGWLVDKTSYNVGFLTLTVIATVALAVFWFLVPETQNQGSIV